MSEPEPGNEGLEGKMYLYEQPEPLSVEEHGELGLSGVRNYRFTAGCQTIPLAMTEFRSAQRHFPIVFSSAGTPMPLAVVGLKEGRNLFVDDDGNWLENVYLPAYLRSYPFALATTAPEQYALVIDRQAEMITENSAQPFFSGSEVSETTQAAIDLCQQFRVAREETEAFCTRLRELDLLTLQQAGQQQGDEKISLARYYGVNTDRLQNLGQDTLSGLLSDGTLAAIMAHQFSMDNWAALLARSQSPG